MILSRFEKRKIVRTDDLSLKDKGKRIYDVDVQEFVAEADVDGDGSVNYEEFVNMIFRGVGIIIEYRRLRMKEKGYFMSI